MRPIRPAKEQQELPFRIQISRLLLERMGITPTAKHLLRVFVSQIDGTATREVFLKAKTMADAIEESVRTVRTTLKELRDEELISRISGPRPGRPCDTYLVRVPNLWERGGVEFRDESECNSCTSADDAGVPPLHSAECNSCTSRPYRRNNINEQEEVPPPPAPPCRTWQEVEEGLIRFPVGAFRQAIEAARGHRLTPEIVLSLIDYARANADRWEDASRALYWRITKGSPGQSTDEGWPPPRVKATASAGSSNPARVRSDGKKFWERSSQTAEVLE